MSSSSSSGVVYEGWMVRYGRRKIGRSFIHMRYFVLEPRLLSYYKRKPQHKDRAGSGGGKLPIKSLHIDGNCRVEDRGLKMHHGHVSSSPLLGLHLIPLLSTVNPFLPCCCRCFTFYASTIKGRSIIASR